ncbi:MAG: DUF6252 family protein [Bacteroidota bacterium]
MKISKHFFLITLLCILFSCSNDDDDNMPMGDPNNASGSVAAKVDGVSWSSDFIDQALWAASQLQIKAEKNDGSLIQISILGIDSTGTYLVGGGNINIGAYNDANGVALSTNILSPEGTVNVATLNSSGAMGTFEFTVTDGAGIEVELSQGTFDISF